MSAILPPTSSSPLNLCLHPELAHGGYSCFEPPLQVLPFWLQRAISCTERRPGWEGARAQVGLAVFGPFSPLGFHSASFSNCIFVCFLSCLVIFILLHVPSRLLTFYFAVFSTPEKLRHKTRPLVQLSWRAVARYFPLTSNNQLLFLP